MDLHLAQRRVLVTGASKGIGRATAELLAQEGCDVVIVARDGDALESLAAGIRSASGVTVDVIAADLSQQADVERVAAAAGSVDILVNNAGAIPFGRLQDVDDQRWRAAWDLKVFGFINLTRALYDGLAARQGVVVNVIGSAGESFEPAYIAGAAGNAALMSFTRALARSANADGLRVVGINPGPVATDRMVGAIRESAPAGIAEEDHWRDVTAAMPFGRPASPEEIANAVAFLASDRSAYTSGTILTIDGAKR